MVGSVFTKNNCTIDFGIVSFVSYGDHDMTLDNPQLDSAVTTVTMTVVLVAVTTRRPMITTTTMMMMAIMINIDNDYL